MKASRMGSSSAAEMEGLMVVVTAAWSERNSVAMKDDAMVV